MPKEYASHTFKGYASRTLREYSCSVEYARVAVLLYATECCGTP